MKNLSDGKSDGIVIMYCKNGTIYPVGLNKEQVELLDLSLGMFLGKLTIFQDKPMGKVNILRKGDK